MADVIGLGSNLSFEDYFVKKLGFTTDLDRVAAYHVAFKEKGNLSKRDVSELDKIAKFDWKPYMKLSFDLEVGRKKNLLTVKILGFLAYGKILLQNVNVPTGYAIASCEEVQSALEALSKL